MIALLKENRAARTAVLLFVLAVVVRASFGAFFLANFDIDTSEDYYDEIALNLIEGNGYVINAGEPPNLWRSPLYPFFLAAVFKVFGRSDMAVQLFHLLFDGLACLVVYFTAKRFFDEATARLASVAFVLYPFFAYYTVSMFTESLFTLFLVLIALALLKTVAQEQGSLHRFTLGFFLRFFLTGALIGAGILLKPALLYFPVFVLLWLLLGMRRKKARALLGFSILMAGVLLMVLPWTARNYSVTGKFILIGTGGGYNLWLGNNVPTDGRDNDELTGEKLELLLKSIKDITQGRGDHFTVENEKRFFNEAIKGAMAEPAASLSLFLRKVLRFWFNVYRLDRREFQWIVVLCQGVLLALGAMGAWFSYKEKKGDLLFVFIIVYFNLLHAASVSTFRYSVPVLPFVMMFAAYGVTRVFRNKRGPTRQAD